MNRSLISRTLRSLAVVSLVVTAASCGGSDTSRQRNSALPDTTLVGRDSVDFEVSWVPEQGSITSTLPVNRITVETYGAEGLLRTGSSATDEAFEVTTDSFIVPRGLLTDDVTSMRVVFQFLDGKGSVIDEAAVEFEPQVGAVKTATITPPQAPVVDPTTDGVVRFSRGVSVVRQTVDLPDGVSASDQIEIVAMVKMSPDAASDATFRLSGNFLDTNGTMSGDVSNPLEAENRTEFSRVSAQFSVGDLAASPELVNRIQVQLEADSKSDEYAHKSAIVTSVTLKINGEQRLVNPNFDDGNEGWTSGTSFWEKCSEPLGASPCTGMDSEPAPSDTTVPADTTVPSDTTVPVDTTTPADTTISTDDDNRQRISLQEVDCNVTYTPESRTLELCESYDEIVVAGFEANGRFANTATGSGASLVLPANLVGPGRASTLRIAVASKPQGMDVAVFRGEGVMSIGDGASPTEGTITVSPAGSEAMNDVGETNSMDIYLTANKRVFFDLYQDFRFAFVTLNGEYFDYYQDVAPPAGWDENEPLFWRAYALDGFGLPRLVANGSLAGEDSLNVQFRNPAFFLSAQTLQVVESNEEDPIGEGNPCEGNLPYLITDPVTPSGTNRVTFIVDNECKDPNGTLGLVVWTGESHEGFMLALEVGSEFGAEFPVPTFARSVSNRYSTQLEASVLLASGSYVIMWGGNFGVAGTHSFRVTAPDKPVSCTYPTITVNPQTEIGTLGNCELAGRRIEFSAAPLNDRSDGYYDSVEVPFSNGLLDFSELEFSGPIVINTQVADAPGNSLIVCWENCTVLSDPGDLTDSLSVSTEGFESTGRVTATVTLDYCGEANHDTIDFYLANSPTSWVWAAWSRSGAVSLPTRGEYFAYSECWNPDTGEATRGAAAFVVESMPNRPSNDDFSAAAEITPDIGRVAFSTVSATSQRGEMAPYSSGMRGEQFASVWFKRNIAEGESGISFRVRDVDFFSKVRIFRLTQDGRLALLDEWWWSMWDDMNTESMRSFGTSAREGTVFYVQILGDWINDVGQGTLEINGGDGAEATVPRGDQPFTTEHNVTQLLPGGTPTSSTSTTTPTSTSPSTSSTSPSTSAPSSSTSSSTPGASDTTAVATRDSTVPGAGTRPEQALFEAGLSADVRTDVVAVLAPKGSEAPVVEARKDAREILIPTADLYATVANSHPGVNTARPLTIRTAGQRPMVVRPASDAVALRLSSDTTEVFITGADASGKQVTAPLEVKKNQPPLVIVNSGDEGSSFPWLWIVLALVALLGAGGFAVVRRRNTAAAAE